MKWSVASLETLSTLGPQYGANASGIDATGSRPRYVRITDIDPDGRLNPGGIVEAEIEDSSELLLQEGDLLFARSGNTVGKTYRYMSNDGPCVFAGYLIRFRINPSFADSQFVFYFTQSAAYQSWVMSKRRIAGQPNINGREYAALQIPLPPISEQRRIVEILHQADALRKKRAEADAKAARILPALFYKMFGDPVTNPKGWDPGRLGDAILETQYGTSERANVNWHGLPVLRMNNIDKNGYLDLNDLKCIDLSETDQKLYSLAAGDILFNRTNSKELVGKTGLWRGQMEAVPASYLIRVRVDTNRALPEFIWAYMNCPFIKQKLLNMSRRAIGMANINAKELRALPLIIPDIDRQTSFAKYLSAIEDLRDKRKLNTKNIERLFVTLLHSAFTCDLTAKWREEHMKELLTEMEQQTKALGGQSSL
jgi:type I restriction enzyme S subunit